MTDQRAAWREIAAKHSDDMFLAFDEHMNPTHNPAFTMDGCVNAIAEAVALERASNDRLFKLLHKASETLWRYAPDVGSPYSDLAEEIDAVLGIEAIRALGEGET